jgi:hypothetical protein
VRAYLFLDTLTKRERLGFGIGNLRNKEDKNKLAVPSPGQSHNISNERSTIKIIDSEPLKIHDSARFRPASAQKADYKDSLF